MNTRQIFGLVLLCLPFVVLFAYIIRHGGWVLALRIIAALSALVAINLIGFHLLR